MNLLYIFLIGFISFGLCAFGMNTNLNIVILSGIVFALLVNRLTLSKAKFDENYNDYIFISKKDKKQRIVLFFAVIASAGALNTIGAFLFAL